jgi:hypothetical protein
VSRIDAQHCERGERQLGRLPQRRNDPHFFAHQACILDCFSKEQQLAGTIGWREGILLHEDAIVFGVTRHPHDPVTQTWAKPRHQAQRPRLPRIHVIPLLRALHLRLRCPGALRTTSLIFLAAFGAGASELKRSRSPSSGNCSDVSGTGRASR